jgi:hypothetical protein
VVILVVRKALLASATDENIAELTSSVLRIEGIIAVEAEVRMQRRQARGAYHQALRDWFSKIPPARMLDVLWSKEQRHRLKHFKRNRPTFSAFRDRAFLDYILFSGDEPVDVVRA